MVATVGGLEESAGLTAIGVAVFPWRLATGPKHGIDDVCVLRIECDLERSGVWIFVEDLLPALAAIERAKDTPFFVRPVRMTERGDEDAIRIFRIDDEVGDLASVFESRIGPRLAGVGRFVNAVAN